MLTCFWLPWYLFTSCTINDSFSQYSIHSIIHSFVSLKYMYCFQFIHYCLWPFNVHLCIFHSFVHLFIQLLIRSIIHLIAVLKSAIPFLVSAGSIYSIIHGFIYSYLLSIGHSFAYLLIFHSFIIYSSMNIFAYSFTFGFV
jgi:hypothetical protein